MSKQKYVFNSGKSAIVTEFSKVNSCWMVWRTDHGHQAMLELHESEELAQADYDKRVEFIMEMEV